MKLFAGLILAACAFAQSDPWKPFEFLLGTWVGEGSGEPGQGNGGFSFAFDLQKKILVRRSFAEYPASRHDDLMVVSIDESSHRPRAIYFDSEGHTIRYAVTPGASRLVFESDPEEPGAHYRLTYAPAGDRLKGTFEIRAPGEAQYKTYLEFTARKSAP